MIDNDIIYEDIITFNNIDYKIIFKGVDNFLVFKEFIKENKIEIYTSIPDLRLEFNFSLEQIYNLEFVNLLRNEDLEVKLFDKKLNNLPLNNQNIKDFFILLIYNNKINLNLNLITDSLFGFYEIYKNNNLIFSSEVFIVDNFNEDELIESVKKFIINDNVPDIIQLGKLV